MRALDEWERTTEVEGWAYVRCRCCSAMTMTLRETDRTLTLLLLSPPPTRSQSLTPSPQLPRRSPAPRAPGMPCRPASSPFHPRLRRRRPSNRPR